MRHIILRTRGWRGRGRPWFIWDRGDCVGMGLWGWGHIRWLVRHWSHCELLTCVVDVFVALFMVGHLIFDEIEGKKMELTSSTCMYSVSHLEYRG